ncbi:MAG: type II secretion system F family protein [Chloroflexi bacterium]|nr:type II secretion system F family protein [Chloroflexota bacterium]
MARVAEPRAAPPPAGPKLRFRYVAVAAGGRVVKGLVKAPNEVQAQNLIVAQGLSPISLEKAPPWLSLEEQLPSFFKVKKREVVNFSRQLATLLESGMSLLPALRLLGAQASASRVFKRVMETVMRDLSAGASFSYALAKHDKVFDEIYLKTIQVGEATGNLQDILRQLADHIETQDAFARQIKSALTYPTIVIVVGLGVAFVLMTVALPPLTNLFKTLNVKLPPPTRVLLAVSGFLAVYKLYILLGVGATVVLFTWYSKRPAGRRLKHRVSIRMPVLGPAVHMSILASIAKTMRMLLTSGLALQEIMEVMPKTVTNSLFQDALESIHRGLLLGQGIAMPMSSLPVFPPLFLQMIRVGEESNSLEVSLKVLGDFYADAASERTHAVVSMIAPLSTVFMGGLAGFIALSVIMPMYSITGAF